jgi:hypothetical protein
LDVGLEPACVVVCPEHAILAGDLSDPASEISQVLGRAQATVRKPEQGTGPKLFYINGNDWSLHPTAAPSQAGFVWADRVSEQLQAPYEHRSLHLPVLNGRKSKSGSSIRTPGEQGRPLDGPVQIGGRVAEHMVQVAYNAQHHMNWHWELPTYLVTKHIAGGLFMLLGLGSLLGLLNPLTFLAGGLTSLGFMLLTVVLLIKDLAQPKRFLNVLLRPQWKSWLARGAYLMVTFTAVAGLWWLLEAAAYLGWLSPGFIASLRAPAAWLTLPLALGVVVYSAFLLGQAEGRDMWQSSMLPLELFAQSMLVSSGVFLALGALVPIPAGVLSLLGYIFPISLAVNLLLILANKFAMPSASEVAALAARDMTRGRYRNHFWLGGIALGHVVPLALVLILPISAPLAAAAAVTGLFFYQYAFVMAPQRIPNS